MPIRLALAHDAPTCGTRAEPSDSYCPECGRAFDEPAPVAVVRPVATPYALAAYSAKNRERILAQCPHATDVRGFRAWLKAGRVVMKGQKGIRIVAPVLDRNGEAARVVTIKPAYVFDVSQTQSRSREEAA